MQILNHDVAIISALTVLDRCQQLAQLSELSGGVFWQYDDRPHLINLLEKIQPICNERNLLCDLQWQYQFSSTSCTKKFQQFFKTTCDFNDLSVYTSRSDGWHGAMALVDVCY